MSPIVRRRQQLNGGITALQNLSAMLGTPQEFDRELAARRVLQTLFSDGDDT